MSDPLRPPAMGEVRVAAEYLGICGSDLHRVFDVGTPECDGVGWPGHEIAGRVVECQSGRLRVGDPVLVVPVPAQAMGFVDHLNIDESRVIPLGSVDTFRGVLCQQVGTVIHALKRFCPDLGATGAAVVVGAGSAGQAFVALLKRRGFGPVIVADRWHGRLKACLAFGADALVRVPEDDLAETVARLTGDQGAPLVVEAAGTEESRTLAMRCVGFRGTVGFFGLPGDKDVEQFPFTWLFRRQVRLEMIAGTQNEPGLASFREAIEMVAGGELRVEEMVSHRFPFAEIGAALRLARAAGHTVRKVVIDVAGEPGGLSGDSLHC